MPLYVGRAETHVLAGHPVIATGVNANNLFIQVTHVNQMGSDQWHVSVHNAGFGSIRATITQTMKLPGLDLQTQAVTVRGGSTVVLL